MIVIDNILISDSLVQQHFACSLHACKGACCVEGESGAPLEFEETEMLEKIYPHIKDLLTDEGRKTIEEKGFYTKDKKGIYKTPLMKDGACAYVRFENGIARCGIQKAYEAGKISFIKPVSCHLYPVRITKNRLHKEHVNYEEWEICNPACTLGQSLKMPLYKFVKEALVRKFGQGFYGALERAAEMHSSTPGGKHSKE
ncbi:MAG TPA: DUF3109 family protein [Chitinophagales bacterium]|nr:DUF3109 family protein [Chitinophagales bacterium]